MTDYWDLSNDEKKRLDDIGIDYDLRACLEYNQQNEFDLFDIQKVLAVWEGQNDEDDWRWILQVSSDCAKKNNGMKFVFLQGGCDYTGWDCQSSAENKFGKTLKSVLEYSLIDWRYSNNNKEVYEYLKNQIKENKKKKTWREGKDVEFGLDKNTLPVINKKEN